MQEVIEKLNLVAVRVKELEDKIALWKENSGTIVVERIVEVVKEVPVEVVKEVIKEVQPDTSALEAKLDSLAAGLGAAGDVISGLTSVGPVAEKAADVVGEAVIAAAEAPAATPATDAFVATEPAVVEETAADIVAEVKSEEAKQE